MSYTNRPSDQRHADMPAVSPLDMPVGADAQQPPRRRIAPKSPRQVLQPEAAPPPPPRSQKARHPLVVVLNFFLMVVVLVIFATGGAFYFGHRHFVQPGPLAEPTSVMIAAGTDVDAISSLLERHTVIDSPFLFTTAVRLQKVGDQLKAGEYLFQPAESMKQVIEDLVSGRSVLHAITFPEGMTSQKIVDKLNADEILTGEITAVPPEGALMPETYKFTRGATRQQILDQMQRMETRTASEIWARRTPGLPIDTLEEFVTLASIVEKETGKADERSRVASVFLNRLREKMRLQSDPTVLYGLFGGAGRPADRPIYQSDLDKPTAYNTYEIDGLPPGPIANPGRAALEAVANPSRTNELYFVADGTGGHVFSATLEQHNRNVARWREIRAEREKAAARQSGTDSGGAAAAPAPAPASP